MEFIFTHYYAGGANLPALLLRIKRYVDLVIERGGKISIEGTDRNWGLRTTVTCLSKEDMLLIVQMELDPDMTMTNLMRFHTSED